MMLWKMLDDNEVQPTSRLEVEVGGLERERVGLGLVPYLARLWMEDPFERHIVFGINMGIDHYSKSVIEGSKAYAFEANATPPPTIPSSSSTPSSLFSPLSHIPHMGSATDMGPLFEEYMPLDYFLFTWGGYKSAESESSSDGTMSHLTHQHQYTRVMDPRRALGGLSAIFGNGPPSPQHPTEEFMNLCKKPLNNDEIIIFKGEDPYCSSQCRQKEAAVSSCLSSK